MATIGAGEKGERGFDAGVRVGGGASRIARADRIVQPRDLILTRFNDRAEQRQSVGEGAQFGKADRGAGARRIGDIGAEWIVELAALDLGRRHWFQRL
jgi:hypothetical protein